MLKQSIHVREYRRDNPEKQAKQDTQDDDKQRVHKTKTNKTQHRETGKIGYTRRRQIKQNRIHKTKTNKAKSQHNMHWTPTYANKHK